VSAWLLIPLGLIASGQRLDRESRMAPVYDHFSHRVGVRQEDDAIVLRLPGGDRERGRELRVPAYPAPGERPRPAPAGVVGVAVDGSLLDNRTPQAVSLPATPVGGGPIPGIEPPRGPAPGSLLKRPDLSALLGVLLDGFPLYGPADEDGDVPGDLDRCGGHIGRTPDHERPIYHYHYSPSRGRICGCFVGTALREER